MFKLNLKGYKVVYTEKWSSIYEIPLTKIHASIAPYLGFTTKNTCALQRHLSSLSKFFKIIRETQNTLRQAAKNMVTWLGNTCLW